MMLKDIFDKKIGELTVREFMAFDDYLNDKHRVNDTEWVSIDEAAALMRRSRRSFEKNYINRVISRKDGGRRLINKKSVIQIIEQANETT